MRRRTRKLLLNVATGVAIAATAAVMLLPAAASAAPAVATANVNVRSGPGTSYDVVGVLTTGARVDVESCRGSWCRIEGRGPDGWVSAGYLDIRGGGGTINLGPANPGISINVPGISIGIGNQPPRPGRPHFPPHHRRGEACFFERANYRGDRFCVEEGDSIRRLSRWQEIGSIENRDGLRVRVCTDPYLRGQCRIYTSGSRDLGRFGDFVASVSVD